MDPLALPTCDAAASAGIWRHKPPGTHMAPGGSQTAPRSPLLCQTASLSHSAWLLSRQSNPHNPQNRRIRARMSGGVGGEEPRGSPLSRLATIPHHPDRLPLPIEVRPHIRAALAADRAGEARLGRLNSSKRSACRLPSTAKALGVSFPLTHLGRADDV